MRTEEQIIKISAFRDELLKEAGILKTLKDGFVKGWKNSGTTAKKMQTTAIKRSKDLNPKSKSTGGLLGKEKARDAFEVGAHVARNKGAYGVAAGATAGIAGTAAIMNDKD